MKRNIYEIEKNVEKILSGNYTGFLSDNIKEEITRKLKKDNYNIYYPYKEAEKVIIYTSKKPNIRLFRISCYKDDIIKHSAIMGSLFSLNITNEMFGDIVKYDNNFYVYLLDSISELVVNNLKFVGSIPVSLEEVDFHFLDDYTREYESIKLIVPSLRIDTLISKLAFCNRKEASAKIKNQDIFINNRLVSKSSTIIKENDTFSIRKVGKFSFQGIIGTTKKDNLIIIINKYI